MDLLKYLFLSSIILLLTACAPNRGNFGEMQRSLNIKSHGYEVQEDFTNQAPSKTIEKFEVRNGDCYWNENWNDCNEDRQRSELSERNKLTSNGDEYWYGWSIYLPKDFTHLHPAIVGLGQFHQKDSHPVWLFELLEDSYTLSELTRGAFFDNWQLMKLKDMRGKWSNIKVHVKWSKKDDGFFKVWVNDNLKVNYVGNTMTASKVYFKYGIYQRQLEGYRFRGNYKDPIPTQIVYYSNVKRVNSEKDLQDKKK